MNQNININGNLNPNSNPIIRNNNNFVGFLPIDS
jgi:hypothetical protein